MISNLLQIAVNVMLSISLICTAYANIRLHNRVELLSEIIKSLNSEVFELKTKVKKLELVQEIQRSRT